MTFGVILVSLDLSNSGLAQVDNSTIPEANQTKTTTPSNQTGNQTNGNPLEALESVKGLFAGK
jgi:hypothetical protein